MQKIFWIAIFSLMVAAVAWFGTQATGALWEYYALSEKTRVTIDEWEVVEERANAYVVMGTFHYTHQGVQVQGPIRMGGFYPNPWAANQKLEAFKKQDFEVWYSPKRPHQIKIRKAFPVKKVVSATVLMVLVIYFLGLKLYIRRQNG